MEYKLGTLYDQDGNPIGVRDTLSWTSYSMWRSSKHSYKKRYFQGIKPPASKEIVFGRTYGRELEADSSVQGSETKIEHTTPCGLRLIGYLDSFDNGKIIEYKTGHVPWSRLRVAKHKQLDFYSMLVDKEYGEVEDEVELIWLETEKVPRKCVGGLCTPERIRFTGNKESFTRKITSDHRQRLYDDVILAAKEITHEYERYNQ